MKNFIVLLVCFSLLAGCSNLEKAKEIRVLGQMKPDHESHHHLYAFWSVIPDENWEETETDEELRRQFELYFSFDVPVGKLSVISFLFADSGHFKDYVEVLDIEEFPTFIILDYEGIVLRTTDVTELLDFIHTLPDTEYDE